LTLSGEPTLLAQGVLCYPGEVGPTAYSGFSASQGRLLYRTGDQQSTRLAWFDRSGKSLGAISEPAGHHEPSLSRDGTKILFGRSEGAGGEDLYLQDLSRGSTTRLTFDPAQDGTSVFSPDESQIVFYSARSDFGSLYRKSSSGGGNEERLLDGQDRIIFPDSWSRDGKYLLFEKGGGAKTKIDLWVLPMTGDMTPYPYLETPYEETHAQFSPDGRWVAYASVESGKPEVYIQSFPIGGGKWQVSTAGGDQPQWRGDGKEIFYLAADRMLMSVSIAGAASLQIGRPTPLFQAAVPLTGIADARNSYVPTSDGQRFLINMLADTTNSQPLTLVLNWGSDLKK
jgi:Tol biopolymer transport system component